MKCDRYMALCCNYTLIYAHLNGTYQGWGVIATMNGIVYQPPWTFRPSCYPRRLPIDTCLVSNKFYKSPLTNYGFGVAMGGLPLKLQNFKKVKLIFGHPVLWCIFMGLEYNNPWVESHTWPQQNLGQRSSRINDLQVFEKRLTVSTYFDVLPWELD